jgi:hypothetical protein
MLAKRKLNARKKLLVGGLESRKTEMLASVVFVDKDRIYSA